MDPIRMPWTCLDILLETMITSLIGADKCNEPYMNITYDLASAKPLIQI